MILCITRFDLFILVRLLKKTLPNTIQEYIKLIENTYHDELNNEKTLDNVLLLAWYARLEPPNYFSAIIESIK